MSAVLQNEAPRNVVTPERERYLTYTDNLMTVVWDMTGGPAENPDPPHQHPHVQTTYVAEGKIRFFLDGVPHELGVGDMIAIPGNVPHCIQLLTERVRLVDSFSPVREDFLPK